eukprot:TRINITY_DN1037_c0_g1_i4.p1 TRINITY_DN1037_c0_g1~~TRINITY_DN1037_c0_g1_i4.p1  ORF type:complete len:405 (-),score=125.14 TRINITY_DN1037_c0_g1_i4:60-1274(-)
MHPKQQFLQSVMKAMHASGRVSLTLNRIAAMRALVEGDLRNTLIGQVTRRLANYNRSLLYNPAWNATFVGEGGYDGGGLYRESITCMCEELQSGKHIFAPSPNGKFNTGANRDAMVPKPGMREAQHLAMFEMVGKLLGISLFSQSPLNLSLPPLIWRALLGDQPAPGDLREVDATCVNCLSTIRDIQSKGCNAATFADTFMEAFVTLLVDGTKVELKPGGEAIPLTFDNRHEWCDLVQNVHLHAYDAQVAALRRGFTTLVPQCVLSCLLTWMELERLVCGQPTLDVEQLRKVTHSSPASSPVVDYLWDVLAELPSDTQSKFLRFVTGYSRMPRNFSMTVYVEAEGGDQDKRLPRSGTCGSTLYLPQYSSREVLKEKLVYAIQNCWTIDTDGNTSRLAWRDASDL